MSAAGDLMTTKEVMAYIGLHNPRGVSVWCSRRGIQKFDREPGHKGQNRYRRVDIERGKVE
jgi:hypothetical protein